jgi:hypothetical protein
MGARQLECEHRFRYVARGVLVVVAFLVCLGVFLLPLLVTGSEAPSAVSMTNMSRLDLETNGNGDQLDETYLVGPVEEVEDGEKSPLNAELLTMLLLVVSFGASFAWLLRNAQRQQTLCVLALVRPSFASGCEDLPFLAVFRL